MPVPVETTPIINRSTFKIVKADVPAFLANHAAVLAPPNGKTPTQVTGCQWNLNTTTGEITGAITLSQ